jgi:hypothetical protein
MTYNLLQDQMFVPFYLQRFVAETDGILCT